MIMMKMKTVMPMNSNFAARQPNIIGENRYKKYAVLVPVIDTAEGLSFVFEKRSGHLRRQPGEICFPGGKLEQGELPLSCAVRETLEELCITDRQITILGPGDIFISPFDIIIYPFIGALKDYLFTFNPDEVSEILCVPVSFFLNNPPEKYNSTIISKLAEDFPYERIPGGVNYPWASGSYDVLFYQYRHLLIWGITAYLVQSAAELIKRYSLGADLLNNTTSFGVQNLLNSGEDNGSKNSCRQLL